MSTPFVIPGTLFEVLKNLNYRELLNFCATNRSIKNICDTDPNILNLKLQKYVQYIMEKNGNDLEATFFYCIETNNIVVLNYLINVMNFDPSIKNNRGLILACIKSNYPIVDLLLKNVNVDPSAQNNLSLFICVDKRRLNIFNLLLNKAKLTFQLLNDLFLYACEKGEINIVKRLLEFEDLYENVDILNKALQTVCEK